MIRLFIEAWAIQTWDWKLFYSLSLTFITWFVVSILRMAWLSFRIYLLERKLPKSDISVKLDEMYRKMNAGIEVSPKQFLK